MKKIVVFLFATALCTLASAQGVDQGRDLSKYADDKFGLDDKPYSVNAIRMERQHELAFEGIRWNDMRRYGKAYAIKALETQLGQPIRNNSAKTVMKDQNAGYKARYEATWGFRPFPQSEISLSNGVLTQNAGWTDASAQYTNWK